VKARVGYSGGTTFAPTYHRLGDHTETIQIDYDPSVISYGELIDVFFQNHTPTHPSHSVQYRSAIFYRTEDERRAAEEAIARIEAAVGHVYTALEPFRAFHLAEDYHQKYYFKQWIGRGQQAKGPSPQALRAAFCAWYGA
jgi:methionine-S-sulfoxide reductase